MSAGTLRAPWGSCARESISSAGNITAPYATVWMICGAAYTEIIYKSLHSSFHERHEIIIK